MTSADFDYNDKLVDAKKEKLEWGTPSLTLMVVEDTWGDGKSYNVAEDAINTLGSIGSS